MSSDGDIFSKNSSNPWSNHNFAFLANLNFGDFGLIDYSTGQPIRSFFTFKKVRKKEKDMI